MSVGIVSHVGTPTKELPIPDFFDPKNAEDWNYHVNHGSLLEQAQRWRKLHDLKPAAGQKKDIHLLDIDSQKDFCHPEGSLYVGGRSGRGAIEDNVRTAEFIYRNMGIIKSLTTTLDTHFSHQIFFATFWVNQQGELLKEHTMIVPSSDGRYLNNVDTQGNVLHENVRPNPEVAWFVCGGNQTWLMKQVLFYCNALAQAGKYALYLWPPHCQLGSDGHPLAGVIHEARMFLSYARNTPSICEVKGGNYLTENYSVLQPEVLQRHDGGALDQKNTQFIGTLLRAHMVIVVGQAKSHCVNYTLANLRDEIAAFDPDLAKKVYIVTDLMSSVTVPDGQGGFIVDFTEPTDKAFEEYANAGMNLVKSTDPIVSWQGVELF